MHLPWSYPSSGEDTWLLLGKLGYENHGVWSSPCNFPKGINITFTPFQQQNKHVKLVLVLRIFSTMFLCIPFRFFGLGMLSIMVARRREHPSPLLLYIESGSILLRDRDAANSRCTAAHSKSPTYVPSLNINVHMGVSYVVCMYIYAFAFTQHGCTPFTAQPYGCISMRMKIHMIIRISVVFCY